MTKRVHSKHVHAALDASIKTLQRLSPDVDELLRRREHDVSDGFPASSMGGSGSPGTISDPTQRTALQRKESDPIAMAIDVIMAKLTEIDKLCADIKNKHRLVFETEENERGRQSSVKACLACGEPVSGYKNDRLYSGYDRKHYDRWRQWSNERIEKRLDPSHVVFRQMIQKELAEESRGKKLVKA